MAKDKDYKRLINTARWRRLRSRVLTLHPVCERCEREGRVTAAHEVHHRVPVEYGLNAMEKERLMYEPTNLMALCHGCHVREHTEMGRSGKEAQKRRNAAQSAAFAARFYGEEEGNGDPRGAFFKRGGGVVKPRAPM